MRGSATLTTVASSMAIPLAATVATSAILPFDERSASGSGGWVPTPVLSAKTQSLSGRSPDGTTFPLVSHQASPVISPRQRGVVHVDREPLGEVGFRAERLEGVGVLGERGQAGGIGAEMVGHQPAQRGGPLGQRLAEARRDGLESPGEPGGVEVVLAH